MNWKNITIFILLGGIFIMQSCTHEPEEITVNDDDPGNGEDPPPGGEEGNCHPDTVYFVNDILPLINSSCGTTGCHDAQTQQDGVRLTDYQSIIQTGDVVAFNPGESEIYEVLLEDDPEKRMPPPPNDPLNNDQIELIRKWIEQGAINNECTEQCDTTNVKYATHVFPVIEETCLGCHSGANPSGGVFLENYEDIKTYAQNGKLTGTINHDAGFSPMPQNGEQLSFCKRLAIEKWIEDGMPDN